MSSTILRTVSTKGNIKTSDILTVLSPELDTPKKKGRIEEKSQKILSSNLYMNKTEISMAPF